MRISGTDESKSAAPGGDVAVFRQALMDAVNGFLGRDGGQIGVDAIAVSISCLLEVQWGICRQTGMTPAQFSVWLEASAEHVARQMEAVLAKQHCNA